MISFHSIHKSWKCGPLAYTSIFEWQISQKLSYIFFRDVVGGWVWNLSGWFAGLYFSRKIFWFSWNYFKKFVKNFKKLLGSDSLGREFSKQDLALRRGPGSKEKPPQPAHLYFNLYFYIYSQALWQTLCAEKKKRPKCNIKNCKWIFKYIHFG